MGPRAAASAVALSFVALALGACGGAVATDLFSGPGGDPSATPTSTPTGTTTGTVPPAPTGTVTPTSTTQPTDPPPPPPPPPVDAGRPDARVDSGTPDAGPDASTDAGGGPGITCGPGLSCGLTQTCCAVYVIPNYRFECRAGTAATCPNPSTDIHCDSSEDCPTSARLCCGDKAVSGTYYNALTCRSSCTGNDVVFCDPASPATSCRTGQKCEASTILKGFHYCD